MKRDFLGLLAGFTLIAQAASADNGEGAPDVVASLTAIHSLVAGVMDGVGEPELLVEGAASPHTYQMRFSDAQMLNDAEIIFWVGEYMETFLDRPIRNLGEDAVVITLSKSEGMRLLRFREGGVWEHEEGHEGHGHGDEDTHDAGHDEHGRDCEEVHEDEHDEGHDGHGHDCEDAHEEEHEEGHDEHGHDGEDAHEEGHEEGHEEHKHDDEDAHDHGHGEFDMHIWLDPYNVERMVDAIEAALIEADPANAAAYSDNAEALRQRISAFAADIRDQMQPLHERPFIVFHDAYRYFEEAFGLEGVGSITVDGSQPPGARRLSELRAALADRNVVCVFSEPQYPPDLVKTITEGMDVRTEVLDPIGSGIEPGVDAWFEIIGGLADAFARCLGDG